MSPAHASAALPIRIGTFNAEAYWTPPGIAALPAVADPAMLRVVATMDELLMPWDTPNATLATILPIHTAQQNWLRELGLQVNFHPLFSSVEEWDNAGAPQCAYSIATAKWHDAPVGRLAPYAVTPAFQTLAKQHGKHCAWPDAVDVAKINSKSYSTRLNQMLRPEARVCVAQSLSALDDFVSAQAGAAFLLKEPFGVSGKGNYLVKDEANWLRIRSWLLRQEKAGNEIELIAEHLLDKAEDFSCYCEIARNGEITFHGLQRIQNRDFKFFGSTVAERAFEVEMERKNYFQCLKPYLQAMFRDGYWGPVCIDSMLLADGTIWPVVEINARESMGIIGRGIDAFLAGHGAAGMMTFLSFGARSVPDYAALLDELDRHHMLWRPGSRSGVLPLSSASLYVNTPQPDQFAKARWYVMLVGESPKQRIDLYDRLCSLCSVRLSWQLH